MKKGPLHATLVAVSALAVALPAWVVTHPPALSPHRGLTAALPVRRVVPRAELPPVEPVKFVALAPDDARRFNAAVPFSALPNPAARPFRYAGADADRARATDCLATGVLYEAGDDATGERAVAQVILNRLRHPAFPKTICGVVFEGAERTTGCQFTFTCDGALTRWKPPEAAWKRAREIAAMALSGTVFRPVGYATHYHTDWVVPYWQSSLDKVAAVGSHLFFRWSGWWGTPPAFGRRLLAGEPAIPALAGLFPEHGADAAVAEGDAAVLAAAVLLAGSPPLALPGTPDTFVVALDSKASADSYRTLALAACGDRPHCIVMGWTDRSELPTTAVPLPAQSDAMAFSYLRDRASGLERTLWNCTTIPRATKTECMKRQLPRLDTPAAMPDPAPAAAVEPLTGIRRKTEPSAASGVPQVTASKPPHATDTARPAIRPPGTSPAAKP